MAPANKKKTLSPDTPLAKKTRGKNAVINAAIKELTPVVDTKSCKTELLLSGLQRGSLDVRIFHSVWFNWKLHMPLKRGEMIKHVCSI
jgi:hypothetical protein